MENAPVTGQSGNAQQSYVITGASSGIGLDAAVALIAQGHRVFGSVRSEADARRLRESLGPRFTPLVFDVRDRPAIDAAAATVEAEVGAAGLHGLVNSAGISISGPLVHVDPEVMQRHLDVNVMGSFHTIQAFFPLLKRSRDRWGKPGRIVNVSALSGRNAYPFMGAYAASKHAIEAISDSLRREMMIYGLEVVVIQPGNINTPIWGKNQGLRTEFAETDYGPVLKRINPVAVGKRSLPVSRVTDKIMKALMKRRPRARYLIPDDWFRFWIVPRTFPDRWFDFFVDRFLRFQEVRDRLRQRDD